MEIGRRSGGDRAEIGRGAGCGLRVRVRVSSGIRAGVGREGAEVERVRLRVRLRAGCVRAGGEGGGCVGVCGRAGHERLGAVESERAARRGEC